MRNTFSDTIFEISKKNKDIFVLTADISPAGSMNKFQKKFPNQYVNVGVAEQLMIGMSAGLALEGKKPFVYTIATFSLFRPFEMIRVDLCYQKLPVTIVGMGAGTIYSNLGGTHMTQEDIAVARAIPNMNILAPCDPLELKYSIYHCAFKSKSPTYLRIGKTGEKNYSHKAIDKWRFGTLRKLVKGREICILSYGPIIKKSFNIKKILEKKKINPEIYSCHTLKPFDSLTLKKIFNNFKVILILEDHSEIGGLAEIVKKNAYDFKYLGKIFSFSLKDEFIDCFGSLDELLKKHGIVENQLVKKILNHIK